MLLLEVFDHDYEEEHEHEGKIDVFSFANSCVSTDTFAPAERPVLL
jgi:hypothetical protein